MNCFPSEINIYNLLSQLSDVDSKHLERIAKKATSIVACRSYFKNIKDNPNLPSNAVQLVENGIVTVTDCSNTWDSKLIKMSILGIGEVKLKYSYQQDDNVTYNGTEKLEIKLNKETYTCVFGDTEKGNKNELNHAANNVLSQLHTTLCIPRENTANMLQFLFFTMSYMQRREFLQYGQVNGCTI